MVPHTPASVASVRRRLVEELLPADVDSEDAAMVITELVSNAVRHARPLARKSIEVGWMSDEDSIRVWVTDGGSPHGPPQSLHPGPTDTSGRGLTIVGALASDWGVSVDGQATTVWATVPARHTASR